MDVGAAFRHYAGYIQKDPWEIGFEQWWRVRDKRDDTVEHKSQEEIEIGLPYRMQLDIYLDWFADGDSRARYSDVAFELRWALADWGKIPLNPTLYAGIRSSILRQGRMSMS